MRYWWVNQNQTYDQEIGGGFLWSPKRRADGVFNHFYDTMRIVAPGDLVLSFRKKRICAVGVIQAFCYESPKPLEFGSAGLNWGAIGWRVDVSWTILDNQIRPAAHMNVLSAHLPDRYSPIQKTGRGNQGVYLAEISTPMMRSIASLVGYELLTFLTNEPAITPGHVADQAGQVGVLKNKWESGIEKRIIENPNIAQTEKKSLILSRRGQGVFRQRVNQIERFCRITHVEKPEHLIASHCKPWRHCSNEERLDGENGLMLTPSIDHLFDRGFISFEDNGRLLISPVAHMSSLERMGIEVQETVNVGNFSSEQRRFLDFHRNDIFLETRQVQDGRIS